MKTTRYIIIALILTGWSCQDVKHVERPDNLIEEDKMVDVLTEIALVNSARNYNRTLLEQSGIQLDSYIYKKFNIDSMQLVKSNDYYTENFDSYTSIYDRVKDSLDILKAHYDNLVEEERKRKDSIEEAKEEKAALEKQLDSLAGTESATDSLNVSRKIKDSLLLSAEEN